MNWTFPFNKHPKPWKKHITIISILFLFIYACNSKLKYEIYGEIENYEGYVFLRYHGFVDSTLIEDGEFTFEGTVDRVVEATITTKSNGVYAAPFYLDNDSVFVKTVYREPFIRLSEVYNPANGFIEQVTKELGAIIEDEERLRSNEMFQYMDSITQVHPKHDFIIEITSEIISSDYITIQQATHLLGIVDTTLMDPLQFEAAKTSLDRQERINPGDQFPDFSFEGFNGEVFTQESFPDQYLLIDVWATWCGPCIQAFDKLKPIYTDLNDQLEILSVSIDPTKERAQNYLTKNPLPWKQAYAEGEFENEFMQDLGVVFLPFYYLISREGEILAINPSIDDIPELIENRGRLTEVMR